MELSTLASAPGKQRGWVSSARVTSARRHTGGGENGARVFLTLFFALLLAVCSLAQGAGAARADVQDFKYRGWAVEVVISQDAKGHSQAQFTETLTPVFPDTDQNKGLVRGLNKRYLNKELHPRDISVETVDGESVPFTTEDEADALVVLIGDDNYVHGEQTYVLRYKMSNVVMRRDDGSADEFYWDVLGSAREQLVEQFFATVKFEGEAAGALNGNVRCYVGKAGDDRECDTQQDGSLILFGSSDVAGGEGVTVAVGLEPGVFKSPAQKDAAAEALGYSPLWLVPAGAVAAVGALFGRFVRRKHARTARGVVVAQYEVPADLPPLLAAPLTGNDSAGKVAAASVLQLAVCGAIEIQDPPEAKGLLKAFANKRPVLKLVNPGAVPEALDMEVLRAFFPALQVGSTFQVPKESSAFAQKMRKLVARGHTVARERGLMRRVLPKWWVALLGLLAIAAGVVAFVFSVRFSDGIPDFVGFVAVAGIVPIVFGGFVLLPMRLHTRAGAELYELLEGVREFIRVAEKDRIQVLQSVSGAERERVSGVNVLRLYERLLPYAVLFDLEHSWLSALEAKYEEFDSHPLWYPAAVYHGVHGLSDTVTDFSSALSSSASFSSSSSGGSSGGGFVGGGGGGGFSGGR